ncbi:MAG: hypothetical protein JWO30_1899 [Fibrobacteres bacterium]|nr:hypothetical protein [Fibrobacterota bacterium]
MAISSLQSLIEKYGVNFGITLPKPVPPEEKPAAGPGNPAPETSSDQKGDTVELSPEAREYQKAHTSPTGKFQMPNLFGDMLGALDGSSDEDGNPGQSSLMDFMGSDIQGSNPNDTASKPDAASAADAVKYFKSLGGFLG